MNDIRPFRGLRYDRARVGPLGEVLCPPYDVISSVEQAALHRRSPFNLVRLELGLENPGDDAADNRYTRAAATFQRWLREGILREEPEPALYLYEQRFPHEGKLLVRRGVLARLRLASWEEGVVLPHEETMAGPKEDRLRLMRATACNLSPLFLLFDDATGTARRLMEEAGQLPADATADTGDGQLHRLWVLGGAKHRELISALQRPQLYMADGHHRYETALAYRDERRAAEPGPTLSPDAAYNFALVLLVDARDPGLVVLPTHRLVKRVPPSALEALEAALPGRFEVERLVAAGGDGVAEALVRRMRESGGERPALGLYGPGSSGARLLRLQGPLGRGMPDSRPLLDVDVLHDLLLAPVLGIGPEQLRAGKQVAYTRDAAEAVATVDRGDAQMAFLLNPTRVEQVLETARAGGKMPQKSTYFYPKPTTGLVLHRL